MTDYAATIDGRARLAEIALAQLDWKRQRSGRQDGDDVELAKRERELVEALSGEAQEAELDCMEKLTAERARCDRLAIQIATLEGKLRDREQTQTRYETEIKRLRTLLGKVEK
jgi:hypothetical protein